MINSLAFNRLAVIKLVLKLFKTDNNGLMKINYELVL